MNRKPSKEEKAILSDMKKAVDNAREIDRKLPDHNPSYNGIVYGHAVEGVRTNGFQRPTTCLDAQRALTEFADELKEHILIIAHAEKEARKAVHIADTAMQGFRVCPECKGEKGTGKTGVSWEDCYKCDGSGITRKR